MNIKSKQGLVLLDAMLADSTYNTHWSVFSNVFKGTDIDYINAVKNYFDNKQIN